MKPLASTDRLPLTCTRDGVCCHGHDIWVNPWETAVLAAGSGLTAEDFRSRYLASRGTRLAFDGPPDKRGKPSCRLYSATSGCTQHAARPLTCRMYPLGRSRVEGELIYYHPGAALPCIELCPSVTSLPEQSISEYLAGQQIAAGEIATDAYARVVYGLAGVAVKLCELGKDQIDRQRVMAFITTCQAQTHEGRSQVLPDSWLDLATIPGGLDPSNPQLFAEAHGQLMTSAVQRAASQVEDSLTEAAIVHLALAVHLAAAVGADLGVMREMIAGVPPASGAGGFAASGEGGFAASGERGAGSGEGGFAASGERTMPHPPLS